MAPKNTRESGKAGSTKKTGTVKWFNEKRGFGFISSDDGEDFEVGYDQIQLPGYAVLESGQFVEFEIPLEGSTIAENVSPAEDLSAS